MNVNRWGNFLGGTMPTTEWNGAHHRAMMLGVVDYLRRVTSWPRTYTTSNLWAHTGGLVIRLERGPIEPEHVRHLNAAVERELEDWALVVSDGGALVVWGDEPEQLVPAHVAPVVAQGRGLLMAAVEYSSSGLLDATRDQLQVTPPPDAGLWVLVGRFTEFGWREASYRPATPDDLRLLGVDMWEWLSAYDAHDGEQVRAVVLAMHEPDCPVHVEAATFDPDASDETRLRAAESALTQTDCTCAAFAGHPAALTVEQLGDVLASGAPSDRWEPGGGFSVPEPGDNSARVYAEQRLRELGGNPDGDTTATDNAPESPRTRENTGS